MKNPALQSRHRGRATLNVAVWLLGLVLVGQLGAIGWAVWRKREPLAANPLPPTAALPVTEATPLAPLPEAPAAEAVTTVAPTPAAPSPAAAVPTLDTPLTDPNVRFFFENGIAAREKGDTNAALAQFRSAVNLQSTHPRLLYELAQTYDAMDLRDKATEVWDQIFRLGEGAGDFYKLAADRFQNAGAKDFREVESILKLGKVLVQQQPRTGDPTVKEQVKLRVPIQALDGATVDPSKVHVDILFYDLVKRANGVSVEKTEALLPRETWLSGAPTWLAGSSVEFVEQIYQLPTMPSFGTSEQRSYHGYIIRLYYNDNLQDVAAQPSELALRADAEVLPTVDQGAPTRRDAAPFQPSSGDPLDDSLFPLPQ